MCSSCGDVRWGYPFIYPTKKEGWLKGGGLSEFQKLFNIFLLLFEVVVPHSHLTVKTREINREGIGVCVCVCLLWRQKIKIERYTRAIYYSWACETNISTIYHPVKSVRKDIPSSCCFLEDEKFKVLMISKK